MTQILFKIVANIFLNISEVVHVVLSKMSETNTCQISLPSSNAIIEHRVHYSDTHKCSSSQKEVGDSD